MRQILPVFLFLAYVAFAGRSVEGQFLFHVTNLGTLGFGSNESTGRAINSLGQVVGHSGDLAVDQRAFLWTPDTPNGTAGAMIDLGSLPNGDGKSDALGINAYGQITGTADASTGLRAFLWTPAIPNGNSGSMQDLGDLPGGDDASTGADINNVGQVVGSSSTTGGSRAFLWTPSSPNATTGQMINLGALEGGTQNLSSARAINSSGQITGETRVSGSFRAFVWTPTSSNGNSGTMVDLGLLPNGGTRTTGDDINDAGVIAAHGERASGTQSLLWTPTSANGSTGAFFEIGDLPGGSQFSAFGSLNSFSTFVASGRISAGSRAFIWTSSTGIIDLNSLLDDSGANWILQSAADINDFGQIVGTGVYDPDGAGDAPAVERAFLLTPVPEPMGIHLLTVALLARRRRL